MKTIIDKFDFEQTISVRTLVGILMSEIVIFLMLLYAPLFNGKLQKTYDEKAVNQIRSNEMYAAAKHKYFVECMTLVGQFPSQNENGASSVVKACGDMASNQAFLERK